MDFILIYITTKDRDQAQSIGRVLVESRLAACANIIDGMQSIYWWNDQICEDSEAVLLVKTRELNFYAIMTKVKELHTYTTPCIISIPLTGGNPDYLAWLENQTEPF